MGRKCHFRESQVSGRMHPEDYSGPEAKNEAPGPSAAPTPRLSTSIQPENHGAGGGSPWPSRVLVPGQEPGL